MVLRLTVRVIETFLQFRTAEQSLFHHDTVFFDEDGIFLE